MSQSKDGLLVVSVRSFVVALLFVSVTFLIAQSSALAGAASAKAVKSERMAVYQHTLVVADEKQPNAAVMTYALDKPAGSGQYVLLKLSPSIKNESQQFQPDSLLIKDMPGSVRGKYMVGDITVEYEVMPLLVGRKTPQQEGAAIYRITTKPATAVVIRCGGRLLHNPHHPRTFLHTDKFEKAGDEVVVENSTAIFDSKKQPHVVALKSNGQLRVDYEGGFVDVEFEKGAGDIVIAYAPDKKLAKEIASCNSDKEYKRVKSYYDNLLQAKIETPEIVLDQAFRSAIYNLEYAWMEPFGWVESVHHWHMMWHMQASGAAAWLGQSDRARDCILSHAERQLGNGAAPQLTVTGDIHKEIFTGGSNQFYAWQIEQYYRYTNNIADITKLGPVLDEVVAQTFEEYDIEGDMLLRWAAQIGNQEDFVHTPYNGTSPSIEGVNMLRIAAKLADARGDREKAKHYRNQVERALTALKKQLWKKDIGRFVYFTDPLGVDRLEGQYHTYIYPAIYDVTDLLDSWTGIRHLRDQLTGAGGEVYASNNFPAHMATSGCQAGAAQQPWAAWGLAKTGLRNEAYKPLKAIAQWVMSDTLRGSWPEVSTEPTPSYFSPPAGLYIQSTIEAIFGLQPDVPNGTLKVAPSLPDHWPEAKISLPDYKAKYVKCNDGLEYTVETKQPLVRKLRWLLPPSNISKVYVNGKEVEFNVSPAVESVLLSVDTVSTKKTHFKIISEPIDYSLSYPSSIAEEQELSVKLQNCKIKRIEDRSGILSQIELAGEKNVKCTINEGLMKPYLAYGRLGQLNFSRRTFFLLCESTGGVEFWLPINLTILPKYETTVVKQVDPNGDYEILIRNNTSSNLKCDAFVELAQRIVPITLNVPPRSEKKYPLSLEKNVMSLLTPGENNAKLILGGNDIIDFTVVVTDIFDSVAKLKEVSQIRNVHISLPESMLKDPKELDGLKNSYGHDWLGWKRWAPHIEGLEKDSLIELSQLPSVTFKTSNSKVVPVSYKSGSPSLTLDMPEGMYRKIYLLVIPYLENHEIFTPVAEVTVRTKNDRFIRRKLYSPGDLDWMRSGHPLLTTFKGTRQDRFGLLPILSASDSQWSQSKPPAYPQAELWSTSLAYDVKSTVMNVIEIDLGKSVGLKTLNITMLGIDSAMSLVAVTGHSSAGLEKMQGTQWMPPVEFLDPITLFSFEKDSMEGWVLDNNTFSVSATPWLGEVATLNTYVSMGEKACGKARSPVFTIPENFSKLTYVYHGGTTIDGDEHGLLAIDLVAAGSNELLDRFEVKLNSPQLAQKILSIESWAGQDVYLEVVDDNASATSAWLGIESVLLSPK